MLFLSNPVSIFYMVTSEPCSSIWTTSTHSELLRNYTIGVIQVTLMESKMRLKNNMEWKLELHVEIKS